MQSCIPFPWLLLFDVLSVQWIPPPLFLACWLNMVYWPQPPVSSPAQTTLKCHFQCVHLSIETAEDRTPRQTFWMNEADFKKTPSKGTQKEEPPAALGWRFTPHGLWRSKYSGRDGGREVQGRNWRGVERAVNRGDIPNPSLTQHRPSPTASRKTIEKLWSWDHQT